MSGQQLCSIISQPWDSGTGWVGSRKGRQCGNHKRDQNETALLTLQQSGIGDKGRWWPNRGIERALRIDSCIKAMKRSLKPSAVISNGNK